MARAPGPVVRQEIPRLTSLPLSRGGVAIHGTSKLWLLGSHGIVWSTRRLTTEEAYSPERHARAIRDKEVSSTEATHTRRFPLVVSSGAGPPG